jgi:putative membrane protein
LYNGFLAASSIWSLLSKSNAIDLKVLFLNCVVVAGVFGAASMSTTILIVQVPPSIAGDTVFLSVAPGVNR